MTEEKESVLAASELDRLITALVQREYEVIGPVMRDEAIVYDSVESIEDLPAGWTDEQEPGRYRLKRGEDGALFGNAVCPQSWNKDLHPSNILYWDAEHMNG